MEFRSSEGGMLDPDDRVADVCDDREQLEAIFDEGGRGAGAAGDPQGRAAAAPAYATLVPLVANDDLPTIHVDKAIFTVGMFIVPSPVCISLVC